MGYTDRKKSGNGFNGSKLNVAGQGISNVIPGGDNTINQKKPNYDTKINKIKRP